MATRVQIQRRSEGKSPWTKVGPNRSCEYRFLSLDRLACSRRSDSGAQRQERRAKKGEGSIRTPGTGY